jgi:hypothetical protein
MSTEEEIPVEAMYWHYPDGLEKMVMNELVRDKKISKKNLLLEPEIGPVVEHILDVFEAHDYVASANAVDPADGLTYRTWTVTPFFLSRIQAQKDSQAEQDAIKMALWNQKNRLVAAAQKTAQARVRSAVATPNMDVNVEKETESEMHDRIIQPQLDVLKKKMQDELAEEKRLERKKREVEEEKVG